MITSAERIRRCNHHGLDYRRNTTMKGWSLEVVRNARGESLWRCRRCAGIFEPQFPLVEAFTVQA